MSEYKLRDREAEEEYYRHRELDAKEMKEDAEREEAERGKRLHDLPRWPFSPVWSIYDE